MRNLRSLIRLLACELTLLAIAINAQPLPVRSAPDVKPSVEFPDKTLKPGQPLITDKIPTMELAIAPTQAIELFNGKDFAGWSFFMKDNADSAATWSVTNGVIHCTGQPYGYIRTEQRYRDYKLTVEWRFVKTAPKADNSGVMVHVQPPDKLWPCAIECQGQSRHQGDLILLGGATCKVNGETKTGRVPLHGSANENPVGDWNRYEIVCSGNTLKVSVNGKQLNEATDLSVSAGSILIQSEGGEIEVRKAVLEPLK